MGFAERVGAAFPFQALSHMASIAGRGKRRASTFQIQRPWDLKGKPARYNLEEERGRSPGAGSRKDEG